MGHQPGGGVVGWPATGCGCCCGRGGGGRLGWPKAAGEGCGARNVAELDLGTGDP